MTPTCGTPTGYRDHNERGERSCQSCRDARNTHGRERSRCVDCGHAARGQGRLCGECEAKSSSPDVLPDGAWVRRGLIQVVVA